MKDEKTIQRVALFIIEKHTIKEAADEFHLSERTIQNYIKELNKKDSKFYNKNRYDRVCLAQKVMQLEKAKEGGKIGKRGPSNSEFDLEEIARVMIEERLGLSVASAYFDIPTSTLYEGLRRLDDENKILNQFKGAKYSK